MSKKINYKNYFPIWFELGAGGTFFVWFINQHDTFYHHSLIYQKQQYDQNMLMMVDVNIENFTHAFSSTGKWDRKRQTLKKYILGIEELNNKKFAIRQSEHGIYCDISDEHRYCKNIIFNPKNKTYIFERYKILLKKGHDRAFLKTFDTTMLKDRFKSINAEFIEIDSFEILSLNENEYIKLLNYINAPYLNNWKDLITNHKKIVGMSF